MSKTAIAPIDHPAAWTVPSLGGEDGFAVDLTARHIWALEDALARLKTVTDDHDGITSDRFPLGAIAADVAAWRDEVRRGRGIVKLRGLPVDRYDPEDLKRLYLGLGTYLGRPVSQSNMGDLIGEVVNIGGKDKRERAYRNSRELKLHTDRCDHLAMLCVRPAIEGGVSGYASALTIHNIMAAECPDLLALLYRGYHHHRFGEQPPGEPPVTAERITIFSVTDGVPSVIYIRGYIDLAVEEGHVELTEAELRALDTMDEIANRPDVRLNFIQAPGEIVLTNNCLLLHTRTAFEDSDDPSKARLLLRLWLREDDRPMAPGVLLHKGTGGIERRDGKGTYYAGKGAKTAG
jgi:hypothetical protein